jgi:hypothetical protein
VPRGFLQCDLAPSRRGLRGLRLALTGLREDWEDREEVFLLLPLQWALPDFFHKLLCHPILFLTISFYISLTFLHMYVCSYFFSSKPNLYVVKHSFL